MESIALDTFAKALNLKLLNDAGQSHVTVMTSEINRPGLQLSGFLDYFSPDRFQAMGKSEITYLEQLPTVTAIERLEGYFKLQFPALIVCRDIPVNDDFLCMASRYGKPVLQSSLTTMKFVHRAIPYLDDILAPRMTCHGVLMDVDGVGILLMGESGIGKSETALELVKRGHRLVADDAVSIKRVSENRLVGESPETIRHFMEIRGVGIIDIRLMYGISAVINSKSIDLVIEMEIWDDHKQYDRLGMGEEFEQMMGISVPKMLVPVRPGRNLAIVVEVAARNVRLKSMGYNPAKELEERLLKQMEKKNEGR